MRQKKKTRKDHKDTDGDRMRDGYTQPRRPDMNQETYFMGIDQSVKLEATDPETFVIYFKSKSESMHSTDKQAKRIKAMYLFFFQSASIIRDRNEREIFLISLKESNQDVRQ